VAARRVISSNQGVNEKENIMGINYQVNRGFTKYSDSALNEFTEKVIASLTGNASFPAPPVTLAALGALQSAFANTLAAAAPGGIHLTAAKNAARAALVNALRRVAAYIQSIAGQDVVMLLSSGFNANNLNRAPSPLDTPAIAGIKNEMSTQLVLRVRPLRNARTYQVRVGVNTGANWTYTMDSTQARRIVLGGLTPGSTYTVQVRGVGGSLGYSDWSDPVSHMVM
jgi:hypothetical protein